VFAEVKPQRAQTNHLGLLRVGGIERIWEKGLTNVKNQSFSLLKPNSIKNEHFLFHHGLLIGHIRPF
jgi:hypothetical protein